MVVGALAAALLGPSAWEITSGLAIGPVSARVRTPLIRDAVAHAMAKGTWTSPQPGEAWPTDSSKVWRAVQAKEDGWFEDPSLGGGYLYAKIDSDRDQTAVLDAAGHGMVYVNGVPRGGDVYATGTVKLPVALKKGRNDLLFLVGRGRLRARLLPAPSQPFIQPEDKTLPDIVEGMPAPEWAGVVIVNPDPRPLLLSVTATHQGRARTTRNIRVLGQTSRKTAINLPAIEWEPGKEAAKIELKLANVAGGGPETSGLELRYRRQDQSRLHTFASAIDGSVQYFAVQPATEANAQAIVLSLHGASVEASGQAEAYGRHRWCHVVCPTNRRPFGFDWEDWGREDALEVLGEARRLYGGDPAQTYLTGHSMGGHGTWSVGMNHSRLWGAIAPAASWVSFASYIGGPKWDTSDPVQELFQRTMGLSDTLLLLPNTASYGVFILHGDSDDVVPVSEARTMRAKLAEFHRDFDWHEEPGQGHWYDLTPDPGADCVDYPPIFDFFSKRRAPGPLERRSQSLSTLSVGVETSTGDHEVLAQERPLAPSRLRVVRSVTGDHLTVEAENVVIARLAASPGAKVVIEGQELRCPDAMVDPVLRKHEGQWRFEPLAGLPSPRKRPGAAGPFKTAFGNRAVLVLPTGGTAAENAWARAKARYDLETWWVRGNGTFEVMDDSEAKTDRLKGRNVVLYGNVDTNRAWGHFVDAERLTVSRAQVALGGRVLAGSYAVLAVLPRQDGGLVGIVGGTDLRGCRTTERLPYFMAGVHYPDVTVLRPESLASGASGVAAAAIFGWDWRLASGTLVVSPSP
ncbi:MAG: prolyl oligopeptidase family serine peptidase [Fimbriimonadaceae bacterium]|nr:MAG: prolyl oligopeptidase family serine peptidase [Fimbriimonadaceae bacterium]